MNRSMAALIDHLIAHHDVLRVGFVGAGDKPYAASLLAQFRSRTDDAAIRPEAAWVCPGGTTAEDGAAAADSLVAWARANSHRGAFQAVIVVGAEQTQGVRQVLAAAGGALAAVFVETIEPELATQY
ncbi:MAG: hypothetical protein WCG80_09790 [Spirochaetales bacterium]